ncbi:MAG: RsmB/NOP family class I SAM-dependent RNA methyltransferase [Gemmatimonadota bacterium]
MGGRTHAAAPARRALQPPRGGPRLTPDATPGSASAEPRPVAGRDPRGRAPDARLAATRVLLDVAAGRRADSALEGRGRTLTRADRALAQEIAFGTLRWKLLLDERLDALLRRGLVSLPLTVQAVLEVAAYQILFLDRIPARAAIHTAVDHVRELLPASQARGLTGVVNATLRALAAEPSARPSGLAAPPASESGPAGLVTSEAAPESSATAAELSRASSHPLWLVERWLERFGPARARALLAAGNERPAVHLRPHAGRIGAGELVERLGTEGAEAWLHPAIEGCVVLGRGDPRTLATFAQGLFTVQDAGAQLVSRLVEPPQAGLVVDVCAAPGGKLGALAERPTGATLVACDLSPLRLRRLAGTASRMQLPLRLLAADARHVAFSRPADLVVADVPCLGTGTLRRRADARWRKSPDLLPRLVELQREILLNAASLLASGGHLLYSTCSLEREENEDQVEWLLRAWPELQAVDLAGRLPASWTVAVAPGAAALFVTPEATDCDGAFAALLERR